MDNEGLKKLAESTPKQQYNYRNVDCCENCDGSETFCFTEFESELICPFQGGWVRPGMVCDHFQAKANNG